MADAGTPTFFSSSETAAAIAASWPVTPSTERNRIRWSSAAFTSTGGGLVVLMVWFLFCLWTRCFRLQFIRPDFVGVASSLPHNQGLDASRVKFPRGDRVHTRQRRAGSKEQA